MVNVIPTTVVLYGGLFLLSFLGQLAVKPDYELALEDVSSPCHKLYSVAFWNEVVSCIFVAGQVACLAWYVMQSRFNTCNCFDLNNHKRNVTVLLVIGFFSLVAITGFSCLSLFGLHSLLVEPETSSFCHRSDPDMYRLNLAVCSAGLFVPVIVVVLALYQYHYRDFYDSKQTKLRNSRIRSAQIDQYLAHSKQEARRERMVVLVGSQLSGKTTILDQLSMFQCPGNVKIEHSPTPIKIRGTRAEVVQEIANIEAFQHFPLEIIDLIATYRPTTERGVKEVEIVTTNPAIYRFRFIDPGCQLMAHPYSSLKWLSCFNTVGTVVFTIPLFPVAALEDGLVWARRLVRSDWGNQACTLHIVLTKKDFFEQECMLRSRAFRRLCNQDPDKRLVIDRVSTRLEDGQTELSLNDKQQIHFHPSALTYQPPQSFAPQAPQPLHNQGRSTLDSIAALDLRGVNDSLGLDDLDHQPEPTKQVQADFAALGTPHSSEDYSVAGLVAYYVQAVSAQNASSPAFGGIVGRRRSDSTGKRNKNRSNKSGIAKRKNSRHFNASSSSVAARNKDTTRKSWVAQMTQSLFDSEDGIPPTATATVIRYFRNKFYRDREINSRVSQPKGHQQIHVHALNATDPFEVNDLVQRFVMHS